MKGTKTMQFLKYYIDFQYKLHTKIKFSNITETEAEIQPAGPVFDAEQEYINELS